MAPFNYVWLKAMFIGVFSFGMFVLLFAIVVTVQLCNAYKVDLINAHIAGNAPISDQSKPHIFYFIFYLLLKISGSRALFLIH